MSPIKLQGACCVCSVQALHASQLPYVKRPSSLEASAGHASRGRSPHLPCRQKRLVAQASGALPTQTVLQLCSAAGWCLLCPVHQVLLASLMTAAASKPATQTDLFNNWCHQDAFAEHPLQVHSVRPGVLGEVHPERASHRQTRPVAILESTVDVRQQAVAQAQGLPACLGGGIPAIQLLQPQVNCVSSHVGH